MGKPKMAKFKGSSKKFFKKKKSKKSKKIKAIPLQRPTNERKEFQPAAEDEMAGGGHLVVDGMEEEEQTPYSKLLSRFGVATNEDDGDDDEVDEDDEPMADETADQDDDGAEDEDDDDVDDETNHKRNERKQLNGGNDDDVGGNDDDALASEAMDEEEEDDAVETTSDADDPFCKHLKRDMDEETVTELKSSRKNEHTTTQSSPLGCLLIKTPLLMSPSTPPTLEQKDLKKCHVNTELLSQVGLCNIKHVHPHTGTSQLNSSDDCLSSDQLAMFNILNTYKDFYYPRQSLDSVESTRLVYCLHLLNHLFKARKDLLRNNSKFKAQKDASLEFRDQGFTHAKVLIVVPMRSSAYKIVQMIITLMSSDKIRVSNEERFKSEYGSEGNEEVKKGFKPDDFEKTFDGNLDDNFKIGLSVCKKTLKLYVDFYASDVIITSPLGLKSVIDSKPSGETDFLSSIELLIIDQAHIFLMQNWSDVLNLVSSLNKQPQQSHGVKLSRVRMWCINGWSSLYRQTIIMSAYQTPEINSLFNKFSTSHEGRCTIQPGPTTGTICNVINTLAQTFRKFAVDSVQSANDARFNYFTSRVISEYRSSTCQHIMIFISSYYDFVRVRNFMKKEDFDFVHICEYTDEKDISRARQVFFKGRARFLLYTERFHFYHRYRIRGVQHIIFYDLPVNSHFYPEVCNMMLDSKCGRPSFDQSCLVVYSRFDAIKLVAVVGDERASLMIQAHRDSHLLMSGDS